MNNRIISAARRIKLQILLVLVCGCMSETMYAYCPTHPERTVYGVRYWSLSREILPWYDSYSPELGSLSLHGFALNPDDETTFIAPDGKIVPKFRDAWRVYAPDDINDWYSPPPTGPSSYSGDIYLVDSIDEDYVLEYKKDCMGTGLKSIRTPLYMLINFVAFPYADNLQKVQIGACYAVRPYSFMKNLKLETVIFEKSPYIYKFAFSRCEDIKDVVLLSETELPFIEDAKSFEDCVYKNATLYLPDELMAECDNDPVWSKFVHKKSLKECEVEIMKP